MSSVRNDESISTNVISALAPEEADVEATDVAERLTQAGWIAKGLIFAVIGILGLDIARRGYNAQDADQKGALTTIAEGPAGRALVLAVGVGLLLFAVWQLWLAATRSSDDLLSVAKRIGWLGLGATYGMLGLTGVEIAFRGQNHESSGGSKTTSPQGIADRAFELPGGRFIVAAIGIGAIIVGAYHLQKGWRREFLDAIDTDDLDDTPRRALAGLGVVGFTARALMLAIAGVLLMVAAWQYDADEAAGIDQSLRTLAEVSPGRVAIGLASLGLVAAGVYDMITFRRQRLDEDDS